jgi:hypothetical protein
VREIEHRVGRIIPWAFCLPSGDRIGDFRKVSASACCVAGVPRRLVHNFRRTAVRNLERAGVPRSSGMKLTEHKTLAVYARYAITDQGMLDDAAAKLAALHAAEAAKPDAAEDRKSQRDRWLKTIRAIPQSQHICLAFRQAPVAQLDRASDFGSEGWGFKSLRARPQINGPARRHRLHNVPAT